MVTKIQKLGKSFMVRIPADVAQKAGFVPGKEVIVKNVMNMIIIAPVATKKRPTLEELVSRITPENRHDVIDWGKPMGKEIW